MASASDCGRSPRPPGVSAALVIHHFGSKDGLRKVCDDYVAEEIRSQKSEAMQSDRPGNLVCRDGRDRGTRR